MKTLSLQDAAGATGPDRSAAYSALDAMGTREILDNLLPRLDADTARTYAFERALQAPALYMTYRGSRVNVVKRSMMAAELERELQKDERAIGALAAVSAVWDGTRLQTGKCPKHPKGDGHHKWPRGVPDSPDRKCEHCGAARVIPKPFEASSHVQGKHLFYDLLGVKPQRNKQGKPSVDDDALDRIGRGWPQHRAITDAIRAIRDKVKQLGTLRAKLGPGDRWHSSVNVGTAWTGRWSSSKSPFGFGGNDQNLSERHRAIFEADPGYEMFYADFERAESDIVAHLAGDEKYIEAHRTGDPHTYVARLLWPQLGWTGDLKADKKLAKDNCPEWDPLPGHDWRFQAKRIQHGGNYGLTPQGIAMIAHIPLREARSAYFGYHDEFPFIRGWQSSIRKDVQAERPLWDPLGNRISLFGRPWDEHTYKQGLAYKPQGGVARLIGIAIWRLWTEAWPLIELQRQVHDAIAGQYLIERREEALTALRRAMHIPIDITDYRGTTRRLVLGVEVLTGQNFGKFNDDVARGPLNLKGLR